MARRRKGIWEDLVDIVSQLHWGVGVSLAAVSYLFLHWYAGQEIQAASDLSDISSSMLSALLHGFANAGQYLLPLLFTFAAATSFYKRWQSRNLYENVESSNTESPLLDMSWREFEMLIGEYFRRKGYSVRETAAGADGGVDLMLNKAGSTYVVQCKQWKASKVGVKVVRELLGVISSRGVAGGFVVTSGKFTDDAIRFASKNGIQLIDGVTLRRIISSTPASSYDLQNAPKPQDKPVCPKCGATMVIRTAKRGQRAGQQFWGCQNYPECRGTLSK